MTVSVKDLCVARGGLPVLAGVSFELRPREALILRGPNGVGKTTLMRTVAGLQPPVSGDIRGAEDRIAYAAHADGLKSMLSVEENLRFWAHVFGGQDVTQALASFRLADLRDRLAGTLSAGQKRRLGLARLVLTGRPVWIMDEPTVSLDREAVAMFVETVRHHLENGGSALIATHIDLGLSEARSLDLTPYRSDTSARVGASDEAFL